MSDFIDSSPVLSGYSVSLRPVIESDLEQLRVWRNDPQVSQYMLSQDIISAEQQLAWFKKIQRDPSQLHFIIEYKQQPIGSANIKARGIGKTLQQADVIEPGLYIALEQYRNNIVAFAPTLLLNDYCFEQLRCQCLRAIVKPDNQAALHYNQKLGYKIITNGELIEIELNFDDYQAHTQGLKALLSRSANRDKSNRTAR